MFGCRELDDDEVDPVLGRRVRCPRTGIPVIDEGDLAGRCLDRLSERNNLVAIGGISGRDVEGEEMTQRIDCRVDLAALAPFVPFIARVSATLGRALQGAAVEDRGRRVVRSPSLHRRIARRSCTMASKHPWAIQRCVCS